MGRDDDRRHSEWPWGPGPVLFRPHASRAHRRRRLGFVALALVLASFLIWPLYPRFATLEPYILGLPFGFAWVIGVLAVMFFGVLTLFLFDRRDDPREG